MAIAMVLHSVDHFVGMVFVAIFVAEAIFKIKISRIPKLFRIIINRSNMIAVDFVVTSVATFAVALEVALEEMAEDINRMRGLKIMGARALRTISVINRTWVPRHLLLHIKRHFSSPALKMHLTRRGSPISAQIVITLSMLVLASGVLLVWKNF
jgi:hypothetical protein